MSLFLKIFLWFWGAMAILALSLMAARTSSSQADFIVPPQRGLLLDAFATYGVRSVGAFERGGDEELSAYLATIQKRTKFSVYLFDPFGNQRGLKPGDAPAPADVRELARVTSFGTVPQFDFSNRIAGALPVNTPRGNYVFCGATTRGALAARRLEPEIGFLRAFSVILVAGLFSYGLARYLASPVGRIRHAAQQIAAGNLSARVEKNRIPRGRDELAHLAQDFDTMADRMEHLVNAQNRLLGDVSHELRSPLTRLGLALELARRGDEAKREAALARIEREAGRLDELIGELLTLSRLENGLRAETMQDEVDLGELCAQIAEDAEFEAQNAGRGVRVQYIGPLSGVKVRGNAELLRRALENLTRNALRYSANDSVVELELTRATEKLKFQVRDAGPGVPDDQLERIFRPFHRVEDSRERAETDRGTGLGLAIAERAVVAHGGTIKASNRNEGGLCVEIELPRMKG